MRKRNAIKMPVMLDRLLSNGTRHYTDGIKNIRVRTINAFTYTFLLVLAMVTAVRLSWGQFDNVAINSIAFAVVLSSQLLVNRGKTNMAVAMVAVVIALTCYTLYSLDRVSGIQIIPQLAISIILSMMLFDRLDFRLGFLGFGIVLLTMVSLKLDGDWALALIFAVQMVAFALLFLIYVYFFEAQDVTIQTSIKRLEDLNAEKNAANRELNERNEELVVFSHIMSHDLKAPLTSILGYAELLQMEADGSMDNDQLESAQAISRAATSMNTLISELLTYSKISLAERSFEQIDLNQVLREVRNLLTYQINRDQVRFDVGRLEPVMGNHDMFKTVFHNLVSNAIKYQPKDLPSHQPMIRIWSLTEGNQIYLFVSDNGIGFKPSDLPKLFKPFQRFHGSDAYEGTGLGMAICLSIVEKYNGTITVKKTSASGTTFQLCFPRPDVAEPLGLRKRELPEETGDKKTSDTKK